MNSGAFDDPFLGLYLAGDGSIPAPRAPESSQTMRGTTWRMPYPIHEGRMFHLDGAHKHEENSRRGLAQAIAEGYDSWDGDMTKSVNRTILNNHWFQPIKDDGFIDPEGKFGKSFDVRQHTDAEIFRLRAPGDYVIGTMAMRYHEANASGKTIVFSAEAKGPNWNAGDMQTLWDLAHTYRVPTIIKSAWTTPLVAARQVGFQTRYTVDHKPGM